MTWDAATKELASGGCAFESMNDSAFGELIAAGAKESEDFGATTFPGTGDSFLAVVDVFVAATKAKNAKNALAFLGAISKPSTQLAFNRAKGSVPVVRDVDVSALTAYQRASSKALWTSPVLLSVAHGGDDGQSAGGKPRATSNGGQELRSPQLLEPRPALGTDVAVRRNPSRVRGRLVTEQLGGATCRRCREKA